MWKAVWELRGILKSIRVLNETHFLIEKYIYMPEYNNINMFILFQN